MAACCRASPAKAASGCLARLCAASECSEAGWPVYACSDGHKRKMSVKSFVTATFDGVPYRRLSAPPEP
ncbi:hypothetical protein [Mesorhizobium sp.]|uniref:hypothetical protein n=1 Tax=Mesorhizobium sp. TaxID=1871066 RepID=UPI0025F4CC88|nr:hypothetical protein [Mesorhizobium sp.]